MASLAAAPSTPSGSTPRATRGVVGAPLPPGAAPTGHHLAYAGLALATAGWATGFIAGKLALTALTPLAVAAWRHLAAALVLLPFALRSRPRGGARGGGLPLAAMVVFGGVLYPWLFLSALTHTSATSTSLLIALNPVLTMLASPLVGERVDARRFGGVLLALAGAVTVITRGHPAAFASLGFDRGDLFALAAAGAWSVFNLASHRVAARLSPAYMNFAVYALGGTVLLLLARPEAPLTQLLAATPTSLLGVTAMVLLSSVLAGQLFLVGVGAVGINRAVVFVYIVPVLTAVLAALLLDERLSAAQLIGGAGVLAGVVWATWEPGRTAAIEPAPLSDVTARRDAR